MKKTKLPKIRAVKAWAVVSDTGRVDPETIRVRKSDVEMTIFDEETGCKVRRVLISAAIS